MKINYHLNPCNTTIELTDHEKALLKLNIKLREMEELLFEAHFALKHAKNAPEMKRVEEAVDPDYYMSEDDGPSKLDQRVESLYQLALEELEHGAHVGDCTCVACSCSKCWAEGMIGIDTIKGVGKHSLYKIDGAARNAKTPEEVMAKLGKEITSTEDWHKGHLERWNTERLSALGWYEHYVATYLRS